MNLNQKYVLELLFLQSTAYIFSGIKMYLSLYVRAVAMEAFRGNVPKFFCAQKSLF